MLPMLTQLETLDILGTVGRPIGSYRDLGQYQFELLAHYLPTSTKNLSKQPKPNRRCVTLGNDLAKNSNNLVLL